MSWNLTDVEWVIVTHWLQLSVAGAAIFYGLADCYKEWRARRASYGEAKLAPEPMSNFDKAA